MLVIQLNIMRIIGVDIRKILNRNLALKLLDDLSIRTHPRNTRLQLSHTKAARLQRQFTRLHHQIHGSGSELRVLKPQRLHVEHAQVHQRHDLHIVELAELRQQDLGALHGRMSDMRDLQVRVEPRVDGDGRNLPIERLEHEELELRDGLLVVGTVLLHVRGEFPQLRRIDLLDLGGDEERRHADQLQAVDGHRLAHSEEAVDVLARQMEGLAVQPVREADLEQPVEQNGAHVRLDAVVPAQAVRLVRQRALLVLHHLPQVVVGGPRERGQRHRRALELFFGGR